MPPAEMFELFRTCTWRCHTHISNESHSNYCGGRRRQGSQGGNDCVRIFSFVIDDGGNGIIVCVVIYIESVLGKCQSG